MQKRKEKRREQKAKKRNIIPEYENQEKEKNKK